MNQCSGTIADTGDPAIEVSGFPMLLATGKANIEQTPRAFVDIAIRNVAGSISFLKTGVFATFAAVEGEQLKREFTAASDSAIGAFENYKT